MKEFWTRTVVAVLLCAAAWNVAAAPAAAAAVAPPFWQSSLLHTAWLRRDGAPSTPAAVIQDHTGMLWFGAADGLFRFDGVHFERIDEIAGHKLLSPNVRSLALYGDALWVGYAYGGISVFEHGGVRHYGEADGVPATVIMQFGRTADGTMWFSSPAGIHWLEGTRWRKVSPADGLPATEQPTLNVLRDGRLLVTQFAGLFLNLSGTHRFRQVDDFGSMQPSQLTADGKLIVMRFGYTPRIFDPATETSAALRLPPLDVMPYSVHRDRRAAWWIGPGDGMRLYAPDFTLKKQLLAPHDFSAVRTFRAPFDDREGNLWFMTENGVDRLRESRLTVQDMPAGSTDFSITAGPEGEVWISSHSSRDAISPPTFAIAADGRRIASRMLSATAGTRTADGTLWFGNPHKLWRWRAGQLREWPLPEPLLQQPAQALAMGDDGRLWVSVARRGVHTFKDGVWEAGGGLAALTRRTALSLHADQQGRIWFGYNGNAIVMLDHGKVREFGAADGLKVGNVLTMFSRRGTLWVGGDQGLARYHQGRFVALDESDGQPFAGVSGIVQTAQGELWLHGTAGLSRIGAADLQAVLADGLERVAAERYNYLDGHLGAPTQLRPLNTLIEADDGRLWYATSASVGLIDPRHIARNPVAPVPQITWLHTDQQRVHAVNGLGLPVHTRNLSIDFTAAVLSIPERARFRVRLIGQDHEWHDAGTLRQAFYTNLGPGDYRFEVMAANEDGVWSQAPASLSFSIAPAFYQTQWFTLLCAALMAGALYLLYLWRLARMTARVEERMLARLDERGRIARALHDTFLQSVHGLSLRFHSIKAALPQNDTVRKQIDAALDVADAVAEEGREQLMGLRTNDAGREDLAETLEAAGQAAAAPWGVRFTLREQGARRTLRAEVHDELLAIAREAIANALRHAGGSAVEVQLSYGAAVLTLTVRDHGKGMDEAVRRAGRARHWGLAGMRERAARIGARLRIDSRAGAGTAVVVSLRAGVAYR